MTLSEVIDGIEARLVLIPGLRVIDHIPEKVVPPCAIVYPPSELMYDYTMRRGSDRLTFMVRALVARSNSRTARDLLLQYLDPSPGAVLSIKAAIEAEETLGGAVDTCRVTSARNIGITVVGNEEYYSADLEVDVVKRA